MSSGQTVREHDLQVYGVDAYTEACALCDAKVDELCTGAVEGRRNGVPHDVRVEAARKAQEPRS